MREEMKSPRSKCTEMSLKDGMHLSWNKNCSEVDRLKAKLKQLQQESYLDSTVEKKKVNQKCGLDQEERGLLVKYEDRLNKLRVERPARFSNEQVKCRNEASTQMESLLWKDRECKPSVWSCWRRKSSSWNTGRCQSNW